MTSNTGTLYDKGNRYVHLDAAGTTIVRSTATRLERVNINNHASGGQIDIYNASGTSSSHLVACLGAADPRNCGDFGFNVALSGGLTIDVTGTPDVTVIYR